MLMYIATPWKNLKINIKNVEQYTTETTLDPTRHEFLKIFWLYLDGKSSTIPPIPPDLAPSDLYIFTKLKKFLSRKRLPNDDEVKQMAEKGLKELAGQIYNTGVHKLVLWLQKMHRMHKRCLCRKVVYNICDKSCEFH